MFCIQTETSATIFNLYLMFIDEVLNLVLRQTSVFHNEPRHHRGLASKNRVIAAYTQ